MKRRKPNLARTPQSDHAVIDDRRTDAERAATIGFVVATDTLMSGWGHAPGRSLFVLAITDANQIDNVEARLRERGDMSRVRFYLDFPRLRAGDHMSIRGPSESSRHYSTEAWR